MLGPTQDPISLGIMESVGRPVTDKAHSVAGVLTPTACHIKRLIKFDSFICTYRIDKRGCSLKQMEGKGWGRDGRWGGEGASACGAGGMDGTGEGAGEGHGYRGKGVPRRMLPRAVSPAAPPEKGETGGSQERGLAMETPTCEGHTEGLPSPFWGAPGPEAVIGARKLGLEQESPG